MSLLDLQIDDRGAALSQRRRINRSELLGLTLVLLTAALCCCWTWDRLGDPIIDFGRDPYTAWQMLQGRQLYHDLAYLYGPLSPFLVMVCFKLFGVSLRTLMVCNLVLLAAVVIVQFRLLRRIWGLFAATAAS